MQTLFCLSVVRNSWLNKKKTACSDLGWKLIYRSLCLLLSVSDMAAFWRSLHLIYSSLRYQTPELLIHYSSAWLMHSLKYWLIHFAKKIYWAQTDIFRMSGLCESFELNRMNIWGWMFSCLLISSYNRNVGKEVCPLSHPELIPQNIRKEVTRRSLMGSHEYQRWTFLKWRMTYLSNFLFFVIEAKSGHMVDSLTLHSTHIQTKEHKEREESGQVMHTVSHRLTSELRTASVLCWLRWTRSYTSGKPPSVLFFYPWIKTEEIVSWRQMRSTAGTEWKVSFNLSLGYNLSGLIGGKHHSFHHGEDVLLMHLNKDGISDAWTCGWFA